MNAWKTIRAITLFLFILGLLPTVHAENPLPPSRTALDDYIAKPDPSYRWEVVNVIDGEGYTAFIVDMVSQTWRSPEEVDRTEWRHWLTVVKPDRVVTNKSMMYIGGGRNGRDAPTRADAFSVALATATNSVVAHLGMIPNQPLTFIGDDDRARTEDDLIAHTWIKFMQTDDPNWAARLPMVKAVVRAMDTVEALLSVTV